MAYKLIPSTFSEAGSSVKHMDTATAAEGPTEAPTAAAEETSSDKVSDCSVTGRIAIPVDLLLSLKNLSRLPRRLALPLRRQALLPSKPAFSAASRPSPSAPAAARRCTLPSSLETRPQVTYKKATRWRCSTSRTAWAPTSTNTGQWRWPRRNT